MYPSRLSPDLNRKLRRPYQKIMIKTLTAVLISSPVLFATAFADRLPIKIEKAWLQAVPPVASDTAAFMTIQNLGQSSIKLIGGFSAIATNVEPMVTTMQEHDGHKMMGMESVPAFEIPPGGTLELKPGGKHLMVMGLKSHPKEGDRVKVVLLFVPGNQQVDVEAAVLKQEPK